MPFFSLTADPNLTTELEIISTLNDLDTLLDDSSSSINSSSLVEDLKNLSTLINYADQTVSHIHTDIKNFKVIDSISKFSPLTLLDFSVQPVTSWISITMYILVAIIIIGVIFALNYYFPGCLCNALFLPIVCFRHCCLICCNFSGRIRPSQPTRSIRFSDLRSEYPNYHITQTPRSRRSREPPAPYRRHA